MTDLAVSLNGPVAIRYPNAREQTETLKRFIPISNDPVCKISADFSFDNVPEYLFLTYGNLVEKVVSAADILRGEGMNVGVILIESLKPYGLVAEKLLPILSSAKRVVYAEEGIKNGGAAEITREELILRGMDMSKTEYRIAAIDDSFASPSDICDLYDFVGLSAEKLADKMRD